VDSLAAAIHFLLTNPADRWVRIVLLDDDPVSSEEMDWLYDTTTRTLEYLATPISGFPTASHEIYQDLASFGSGCCQAGPPRERLRFVARPLSGTFYLDDDEGEISDVFSVLDVRIRDVIRTFGSDAPDFLRREAMDPTGAERKVKQVHHVWNRGAEANPHSVSNLDMRWGSRYVLLKDGAQTSIGGAVELSLGGFRQCPYLTPRWSKAPGETYGRGPGMSVLPAIRLVNRMSKDQLVAGAMKTRPPINVWDASLKRRQLDTSPSGVNYLTATTKFPPTFMQTGADPSTAEAMIERVEQDIERAFYLDTIELPLIRRSHSAMTAEEVMARRQQALARASPVVSRLQAEWCVPVVMRTIFWLWESGRLSPMPDSLRSRMLKLEFTSPMAQSQSERESSNIVSAIREAAPVIAVDPGAAMNIDADLTVRAIWNNRNADPRLLRPLRQVKQIRQQEAEQAQQAQQATLVKDLAQAGKDAGQITSPV
jgi:hypothetical protein